MSNDLPMFCMKCLHLVNMDLCHSFFNTQLRTARLGYNGPVGFALLFVFDNLDQMEATSQYDDYTEQKFKYGVDEGSRYTSD